MDYRDCFLMPPNETEHAIRALIAAAQAHSEHQRTLAARYLQAADCAAMRKWVSSVQGRYDPLVHGPGPTSANKSIPASQRDPIRMPPASMKKDMVARDGWQCRFCSLKLMPSQTIKKIIKFYPDTTRWGGAEREKHALLRAMWAQYDHILPHSSGGKTQLDNLVMTCGPCNYGRNSWTLEDCRLNNPLRRKVVGIEWDGLTDAFN